ncbi:MAG: GNAT family N-acetyltransferase [Gammaproteobacteria bacterium]|nr:GNAT family N-acetyltransferase [Gammaproteobacteria bacterium]
MSIRPANETDVPQIAVLVKSLAHYYLNDPSRELPSWLNNTLTYEAFADRISSSEYLNFVYEEAGTIVGYISINRNGHLYHLFVAEQSQGKGISRLIWEHAKQYCECVCFSVRSSLYAIPVYKRFGFCETGPVGTKDGVSFQPMELTK